MATLFKYSSAIVCSLLLLSACTDETESLPTSHQRGGFQVSVIDNWNGQDTDTQATRGALITNQYTSFWSTFGLWSTSNDILSANSQMEDDGNRNNNWTLASGDINWPANDGEVTFFAIAPYKTTVYEGMANSATPSFTFTTAAKAVDQDDVMVATNVKAKASDPKVTLPFNHIMTAVKFKTGAAMQSGYKISNIEITGIYTKNTFTLATGSTPAPGTWGTPATTGTVSQGFDFAADVADTYITDDTAPAGTTFILLPQTTPSGAKVLVTFTDGVSTYTIDANLAGKTWEMGHTYTYTITSDLILTGQHTPAIEDI